MHVIEVIPLRRGTTIESLSYYSRTEYTAGDIVTVPIRGTTSQAIVLSSQSVSATKTALRSATFTLRKLPAQPNIHSLPPAIVRLAETLKQHYPATVGSVLYSLLPKEVQEGYVQYPTTTDTANSVTVDSTPQTIQAPKQDRYTLYQSHIRTVLGRNGSILCIVPSANEILPTLQRLNTGIENFATYLSPHDTKRNRKRNWEKIHHSEHPLLIVTTPAYAAIGRQDIACIIVEQSGSNHYRQRTRPYLDYTSVFIHMARGVGASLLLGDTVLRTEHEHKRREDIFLSYDETPKRLIFPARIRVMTHPEYTGTDSTFSLFTDETVNRIQTVLAQRKNVFLYAARRGLAPLIICFDCGEVIRCPESGNPYSLFRTEQNGEEQRWFVDTTSGKRVRAADTCAQCGSWRLRERGIGIQHIHDALNTYFSPTTTILFDSTTASTAKKANALATQAQAMQGGIILGTTRALPFLPDSIAISCVTSLEAAQTIPSWRADEMFFRLLLELREKSTQEVLLQTRSEVSEVVKHAERGAIEQFYNEEIELRQMLHYPPFSTIILCTWAGNKEAVAATERAVTTALNAHSPHVYSHPYSSQGRTKRYALIRIPHEQWPDKTTLQVLEALPPHVQVEINPDRIV